MCILNELERSIQARIPINIVYTTDTAQVLREITQYLVDNYHYLWAWGPILGHRDTTLSDNMLRFVSDYNQDSSGDPNGILHQWIEELQNTDVVYRVQRDGMSHVFSVPNASRVEDFIEEGERARKIHKTLVLIGSEIWLNPDTTDYDPLTEQALWEIAQFNASGVSNICLIVPSGTKLGEKLTNIATNIEDGLPSRTEFSERIWPDFVRKVPRAYIENLGDPNEIKSAVVDRLCGLARPVARNALTTAIIHTAHQTFGELDSRRKFFLDKLGKVKENNLRRSSALELLTPIPRSAVGGLNNLLDWIVKRRNCFTDEARAKNIAFPKGILLVGPPGTGKTHTAKAVASMLGIPALRGDIGALFGGLVGQSESNTRTFLDTVEAMSPCVLLIDEIEKGLGGAGSTSTDGGTTQRVFGTILSWMQDRNPENPVFVVATANDISHLPPELLRKGRFDEIWFVDLPQREERRAILDIHLRGTKDPQAIELAHRTQQFAQGQPEAIPAGHDPMATALDESEGFVGAELAQAVIEAQIDAFSDGQEFTAAHLEAALRATKPLSVTQAEKIQSVRVWAKERARRASAEELVGRTHNDVETKSSLYEHLGA